MNALSHGLTLLTSKERGTLVHECVANQFITLYAVPGADADNEAVNIGVHVGDRETPIQVPVVKSSQRMLVTNLFIHQGERIRVTASTTHAWLVFGVAHAAPLVCIA